VRISARRSAAGERRHQGALSYEEAGSGFPLFVIPGGGQNSTIGFMSDRAPFNATEEFKDEFLTRMYVTNADFVFSVPRAVVASCQVPVLIMPDETPAHPYEPAIESAMLAPKAEMTFFPWKDTKDKIPLAVRHVRTFLKANRPA
jgi:hypothetical protein